MSLINIDAGKIIDSVSSGLNSLFTSDDERAQAEILLEKLRQKPHVLQAEINKIDARSKNIWQSGWRPAIGWSCAAGFFYLTLLSPILQQLFQLEMPEVEPFIILNTMFALLGMGGLRTFEKIKGKA